MFPHSSADTVALNPHLSDSATVNPKPKENESTVNVATKRRSVMNKTEAGYSLILEAMKRKGEILRYEFEGVTLRFANVKYTPDFVVFGIIDPYKPDGGWHNPTPAPLKFIEVKGPFIKGNRERAVERFRHAKTYWPEFTFEMHQKTKEGWKQII